MLPSNVSHILFICVFITVCSYGLAHLAGREKNVTFLLVVMAKNRAAYDNARRAGDEEDSGD